MISVRFLAAGDQGLVVEFGSEINSKLNLRVHQLAKSLVEKEQRGIIEVIPTYRSLLVYFEPLVLSRQDLTGLVSELLTTETQATEKTDARLVYLPVCYGGEFGPDLEYVASHNNMSVEEVVEIHTSSPYQVYMLGFTPGFPYLGGMSERIATPRLEKPRVKIPAGSVGIAGSQTGFYPIESPGGWQLIGRTPIKGFDSGNQNPFAFSAGDYLQFFAVSPDEYQIIYSEVEAGKYQPKTGSIKRG